MAVFHAYSLSLAVPLAALLLAALLAVRAEGHPLTWMALRERFRLHRMNRRAWLWTIAAFVIAFVGYGALAPIQRALAVQGLLPVPNGIPAFMDPRVMIGADNIDQAFGNVRGNWLVLIIFVVLLFFNIAGEELWWRGYVLPRQELAFGHWTWLAHGLMWNLFHVFKWWDLLALLPVTLLLSFLVLRLRNTTSGIVLHTLFNGLGLITLLLGVLS
jgi:membrane protease YdiL (CAAX protease family)